ncbi:hypothetical protein E2C01_092828 [Portunus trituberculatus]|uniref:Uncharacterized protein n=1 Tax=Portunus trituberculatus TaxID=210409 RepID=A0A5B7JLA0_PORTR|nr:hypothetical protein [Portunus trituberculatus]
MVEQSEENPGTFVNLHFAPVYMHVRLLRENPRRGAPGQNGLRKAGERGEPGLLRRDRNSNGVGSKAHREGGAGAACEGEPSGASRGIHELHVQEQMAETAR